MLDIHSAVEVADADLLAALRARFATSCTHQLIEDAEQTWSEQLWADVDADGFATVGVPEAAGGSGGSVVEACAVLRAAGAHAVPLPLAESGLLGGWLASRIGALPDGLVTIAPTRAPIAASEVNSGAVVLRGAAVGVPWARDADHIAVLVATPHPAVVLVGRDQVIIETSANLAGEPRDTVRFGDDPVQVRYLPAESEPAELYRLGALSRAALIAGAIERMVDLTLRYTEQRRQFGRPIGRFQAVQQHLATLAESAVLTTIAVEAAASAVAAGDGRHQVAAAKVVAGQCAAAATKAAHQAHGAMGVTREYPLHQFSRRVWSWSAEYGNARYWATCLGTAVAGIEPDQLYPFITDPRAGERSEV